MELLPLSPEGRKQAGDKEGEQVLWHLENGTEGVSRAVSKHHFLLIVCFVEGWGCRGIHKLLLWQQVRKGHLTSSRPPAIRWFFDLPAHLDPCITTAYPEAWKNRISNTCPGQSCSQCAGMDSRDQGKNVRHKGNFLFSVKQVEKYTAQLDKYMAWVSRIHIVILGQGQYSLKISLV